MAVFLICEFDPFHYGHEYIISEAKKARPGEALICVMSGNFVQRGRPASYDAYSRAECAVKGGADLILSLPFPWCMSSAEHFAFGALSVISGLYRQGDALVFGSECGDINALEKTADELSSPDFTAELTAYIKKTGLPYAKAREALSGSFVLSGRNDILGVEYLIAAKKLCPGLIPIPVKRNNGFLSSTEIKKAEDPLEMLPPYAKEVLYAREPACMENAERILLSHLRASPFTRAVDGEHGLLSRISAAAREADGLDSLLSLAASSQFTNARIRRVILYSYFNVDRAYLKEKPCFTQLFAADKTGLSFLSDVRKTKTVQIITKPSDISKLSEKAKKQYGMSRLADGLYCFCTPDITPASYFPKRTPYIEK